MLKKNLKEDDLLGDILTASKQAAGREVCPAGFLVHVCKTNLNNFERDLKKFKASIAN